MSLADRRAEARSRRDHPSGRRRHLQPAPAPASANLRQVVNDMPDEYVQCRDWGHNWAPYTARPADYGCFESVIRCTRCKTKRTRTIGPRGAVLRSDYDYADGYLVAGMGRLTGSDRDMLRLASVLRLIEGGTPQ